MRAKINSMVVDIDALCLVDADDEDVRKARDRFPGISVYRRGFDGDLPHVRGTVYLLKSGNTDYSSVSTRPDVSTEVEVAHDVYCI